MGPSEDLFTVDAHRFRGMLTLNPEPVNGYLLTFSQSGYSDPGVQQPVKQIHHQIYEDEQKADHQD